MKRLRLCSMHVVGVVAAERNAGGRGIRARLEKFGKIQSL